MSGVLQSSRTRPAFAGRTCAAISSAELALVARVPNRNSTDIAVALSPNRLAVVRCVHQPSSVDHTAVATMISQGDFVWAAIVCSEAALPDPPSLIECFHVDELDQLVSRLVELRGVFNEAR